MTERKHWFRPTANYYDRANRHSSSPSMPRLPWSSRRPPLSRSHRASSRSYPQAIDELFGITFTPPVPLVFEAKLAKKSQALVDDIAKKLGSSRGAVHADETYGTLDGDPAYFWGHPDEAFVHFEFLQALSPRIATAERVTRRGRLEFRFSV